MKQAARPSEDEDWAELDDLVAEQIVALAGQRRPTPQPRKFEASDEIEAPAPEASPAKAEEDAGVRETGTPEAPDEDDEERYFALCRVLGAARDPRRLIERLVADLPPPPAATSLIQPIPGEVANEG